MPLAWARAFLAWSASVLAVLAPANAVRAAAIERAVPSTVQIIFEPGTYGEFGATWVDPRQDGSGVDMSVLGAPATLAGRTGDMFDPQWSFNGALKADLAKGFAFALLFNQPYGAATTYSGSRSQVASFYAATRAQLDSRELTGVLAWTPEYLPAVKLYAGVRAQWLSAHADIPFIAGYRVNGRGDWGTGYLVGAAVERPDIAFRAALTYSSSIHHRLGTLENSAIGAQTSTTDVSTPQAVTFEIQSGIAPQTLAFGSVRWVEWSEFNIDPGLYHGLADEPLVDYSGDWWTWTGGLARQLTDALAGSISVSYEPSIGGQLSTLGPYDGRTTATAALSYDFGRANLTGGVTWGLLGDTSNALETDFDDGSVLGFGMKLGMQF